MADVTQAEIAQLQYLIDEARKQSQHPLVPPNETMKLTVVAPEVAP